MICINYSKRAKRRHIQCLGGASSVASGETIDECLQYGFQPTAIQVEASTTHLGQQVRQSFHLVKKQESAVPTQVRQSVFLLLQSVDLAQQTEVCLPYRGPAISCVVFAQ